MFCLCYAGGTNAERFNIWLRQASEAAGQGVVTFVLDNASCHRRWRECHLPDNHVVRFLPAYSPYLNIAENCFSSWKAAFKREMAEQRPLLNLQVMAMRNATMIQLCEQNLAAITVESCVAYFRRTTGYVPRMLQLLEIVDHA
jgi:hypothetical protein